MKKFKRALSVAVLVITALGVSTGCTDFRDIRITSCELRSVSPTGLRTVECSLAVGVHNPSGEFTVSTISGHVRKGDFQIVNFSGGPICVERRSDNVYDLPFKASLSDGCSLFGILDLVREKDFSGFVADIAADVVLKNGLKKKMTFNDIPLQDLLSGQEPGRHTEI